MEMQEKFDFSCIFFVVSRKKKNRKYLFLISLARQNGGHRFAFENNSVENVGTSANMEKEVLDKRTVCPRHRVSP